MARERRPKVSWPAWFHAPNGDSKIFHTEEDVPDGWTRKKPPEYNAPAGQIIDDAAVRALLVTYGVIIDPRWGRAKLAQELKEAMKRND